MTDPNTNPEQEQEKISEQEQEKIAVPPQVLYGISIFQCEDDHPVVHVTGEPDLGQLQRLLVVALSNMQADIIATKVVQKIQAAEQASRIIRPGG